MQTIEERLDQLEKRNKRLTAALTLMAVAMCAVVTVAATAKLAPGTARVWARRFNLVRSITRREPDRLSATIACSRALSDFRAYTLQPERGFTRCI